MPQRGEASREALILSGIQQLQKNGLAAFSMRKAAQACGLSCAAPYKHFADKEQFIGEILAFIRNAWVARQGEILARCPDDERVQLTEMSMGYVRFLLDNPHFRTIVMMGQTGGLSLPGQPMRTQVSPVTKALVEAYCGKVGMGPQVMKRKMFVVRSVIFGAALMMDSGELPDDRETEGLIRAAIVREFDLS